MLRIILFAISCAAFVQALPFTDCSDDRSNTVLTVHSLGISPMPVTLPGEISFSISATVNRQIDYIFIQTQLSVLALGVPVEIPCIGNTYFGSCDNIEACSIMESILNGSSITSDNYEQQLVKMFIAVLGPSAQCPINPGNVLIYNYKLQLEPFGGFFNLLNDGDFILKIIIREDPTSTDFVGCIEFNVSLALRDQPVG